MADGTPIIIKKKKGHGHGHHGGAWKVAYADFVTAMMAFFMVMWIMGMTDSTRSMIQGYFNDPLGFTKNEPKSRVNIQPSNGSPYSTSKSSSKGAGDTEIRTERTEAARAAAEIKNALKGAANESGAGAGPNDAAVQALYKNVEVSVNDEGLVIDFVENAGAVFFEVGSSQIRPGALTLIRRVAPILTRVNRKIVIEGHTDARPYVGNGYDNWDLSNDRAFAMRRALRGSGVPSNQFLEVRAYGPTRLKVPEDPYHFSNRRVTVLLPFTWRGGDKAPGMPRDLLNSEIQGVFKRPVDVGPATELVPKKD